jgi:hypothetical protein
MKAPDIRKSAALLTILFFGGLSAMGGYIANMHSDLMDTWEGLAMIGAPAVMGLVFLMVSMLWKLDDAGTLSSPPVAEAEGPSAGDELPDRDESGQAGEPAGPAMEEEVAGVGEPGVTVVQVLGLFQREGRLLDFLQEDITPYSDEQIGAAVREVHKGCRGALLECFNLAPVLDAEEGSDVEVDEDFNPLHIRLTGNVHGKPPFKGVLRHGGWRYTELNLPEWSADRKTDVIAPAEVEIT